MKIAFIYTLLSGDIQGLKLKLILLGILYFVMFCAIILDLIAGIRKSKQAGEFINSFALRRTVDKMIKYFNLALIFTLGDVVLSMLEFYNLPYATALCAIIVCIIEIKSVFEKYDKKEKAKVKDAARTVKYVLEHKDDLLSIMDGINELKNKKEE